MGPADFLTIVPNPHNRMITQQIKLDDSYRPHIIKDLIYALEIFNTKQMTGLSPWDFLDSKKNMKLRDIHIMSKMSAMQRDAEEMRVNSARAQQASKSSKRQTVRRMK